MMATEIAVDGKTRKQFPALGYRPQGEFILEGNSLSLEAISHWTTLRHLLECAFICNNARLEKAGADYRVIGDPTEGALVCLAEKAGMRGDSPAIAPQPFESIRKRMSVIVKTDRQSTATIYVKGAPVETLAAMRPNLNGRQQ